MHIFYVNSMEQRHILPIWAFLRHALEALSIAVRAQSANAYKPLTDHIHEDWLESQPWMR